MLKGPNALNAIATLRTPQRLGPASCSWLDFHKYKSGSDSTDRSAQSKALYVDHLYFITGGILLPITPTTSVARSSSPPRALRYIAPGVNITDLPPRQESSIVLYV